MSIELTPPVSALEDWLDTATRGLCDEAYFRIADEIEAHVAEHVEHLQQEGLSEEEAEEKCLKHMLPYATQFSGHDSFKEVALTNSLFFPDKMMRRATTEVNKESNLLFILHDGRTSKSEDFKI